MHDEIGKNERGETRGNNQLQNLQTTSITTQLVSRVVIKHDYKNYFLAAQQPFLAPQQPFFLPAQQPFFAAQQPFLAAWQPFLAAQQPFLAAHLPAQPANAGAAVTATAATTDAVAIFFNTLVNDVDFIYFSRK
ncbi:MAG: hypothetical protein K2Y28_10530 [Burkholderiaceae bacterium]|nr:hypothetical protein [Burkholderiaceae bacterium]